MKKTDLKLMTAKKRPNRAIDLCALDALAQQVAAVEALARSMPRNINKDKEFGRDNAISPAAGQRMAPQSKLASASTLSESNLSAKTGGHETSLDRARIDATDQVLTTNQGVAIGDNQNSLKAGLRGPSLLKTSYCVRRSPILTTNGSLSASCMPAALPPMDFSRPTSH